MNNPPTSPLNLIGKLEGWGIGPATQVAEVSIKICLLYTSDAADERSSVDLGGRRIIKKKKDKYLASTGIIEITPKTTNMSTHLIQTI